MRFEKILPKLKKKKKQQQQKKWKGNLVFLGISARS